MSTESPAAPAAALEATALAVSLTVKDIARSLEFYVGVLGFAEAERHQREGRLLAVSLKAGDVRILLNQDDGARGWDRPKGEGFSLQLTTEQDVDELAAGIKQRGGTLTLEPTDTPWGMRVFRVQDPDGFKLAISTPRK